MKFFGIFRLGLASKAVCAIMRAANGSVAERLNAPVLKTGVEKSIVSSNLTGPASTFYWKAQSKDVGLFQQGKQRRSSFEFALTDHRFNSA